MFVQTCPICRRNFDQVEPEERWASTLIAAPGVNITLYPCPGCARKLENHELYDGNTLDSWYLALLIPLFT